MVKMMLGNVFCLRNYFPKCLLQLKDLNTIVREKVRENSFISSRVGSTLPFIREFHIHDVNRKGEDRREMLASMPARDEGTEGEKGIDIDSSIIW